MRKLTLANDEHMIFDIARLHELLTLDASTGVLYRKTSLKNQVKAGDVAGCLYHTGYIVVTVDNVKLLAHRIVWAMTHGCWPSVNLDHINGLPSDNRPCNLREASYVENMRNRKVHKNNTSGVKGVSWSRAAGRWTARIKTDTTYKYLGLFDSIDEASLAYSVAADIHHGEFKRVA